MLRELSFILSLFITVLLGNNLLFAEDNIRSKEVVVNTWAGFKHFFIDQQGRVKRNKSNDTVSEAQAYAMLRAVWMNDKETFDKCYSWTENNMSRLQKTGDNLLAWHWKDGEITDLMPASDADVDYALSLIFADKLWGHSSPNDLEAYGQKAKAILHDILELETYSTTTDRFYLSPWIINRHSKPVLFPVNPSYYSPAHFRIFYQYTGDIRWLDLVDTTYFILNTLSREFNGEPGVGLIPDWCSVDDFDKFRPLEGKHNYFGTEAIRIPFRVALDFIWFKSTQAKEFFLSGLTPFLEQQLRENNNIFCEYNYNGQPRKKYESPAFYSCYYYALSINNPKFAAIILQRTRSYISKHKNNWIYQDENEYYVNSLSWFADGFNLGIIRNLYN